MEYSLAERLARAVLMFHGSGIWTREQSDLWYILTDRQECTSKTLCDFARYVIDEEQSK